MPILTINITVECEARLAKIAEETARTPSDLAATAAENEAEAYFRNTPNDDPARQGDVTPDYM